mmetsp:Transcript_934/g.1860  ORF Transcript_934/g.1860 Transcript_934/m.1860 type:complete len:238 (+) Transcript_934:48-761(+)
MGGLNCTRADGFDTLIGNGDAGNADHAVPVKVNVYNIGTSSRTSMLNSVLRPFGSGAFHVGVEVYGLEWSFSDIELKDPSRLKRSGIFSCWPKQCKGHTYIETVDMGTSRKTEVQVLMTISQMEEHWPVSSYNILRKNCCHFVDELCVCLGVGQIPPILMNLAGLGASIARFGNVGADCCSSPSSSGQQAVGYLPCCDGRSKTQEVEVVESVQSMRVLSEDASEMISEKDIWDQASR